MTAKCIITIIQVILPAP